MSTLRNLQALDTPAEVMDVLRHYFELRPPDPGVAFVTGAVVGRLCDVAGSPAVRALQDLIIAVRVTAPGGSPELREALQRAQRVVDARRGSSGPPDAPLTFR